MFRATFSSRKNHKNALVGTLLYVLSSAFGFSLKKIRFHAEKMLFREKRIEKYKKISYN